LDACGEDEFEFNIIDFDGIAELASSYEAIFSDPDWMSGLCLGPLMV